MEYSYITKSLPENEEEYEELGYGFYQIYTDEDKNKDEYRKLEFRDYKEEEYILEMVRKILNKDVEVISKRKGKEQVIYSFYLENSPVYVSEKEYSLILEKVKEKQYKPRKKKEEKKLSIHKLMKENKFVLKEMLNNYDVKMDNEEMNDCLVHDHLPYGNYDNLKIFLHEYYSKDKDVYHKKTMSKDKCYSHIRNSKLKGCDCFLLKIGDGFCVYSRDSIEEPDEGSYEESYDEHLGSYDSHNFGERKDDFILPEECDIEIKKISPNMATIYINDKEIPNFYIPDNQEPFLYRDLKKKWKTGFFLSSWERENYKNTGKIVGTTVPENFVSVDEKSYGELMNI